MLLIKADICKTISLLTYIYIYSGFPSNFNEICIQKQKKLLQIRGNRRVSRNYASPFDV